MTWKSRIQHCIDTGGLNEGHQFSANFEFYEKLFYMVVMYRSDNKISKYGRILGS